MTGPMHSIGQTMTYEETIPGIIVNRYSDGIGIVRNWSIFATGDIEALALYAEAIFWAAEN